MGFYGNITNASTPSFQFDIRYPNKRIMDLNADTDGVLNGRYVLVEYDDMEPEYVTAYLKDGKFYTSIDMDQEFKIFNTAYKYIVTKDKVPEDTKTYYEYDSVSDEYIVLAVDESIKDQWENNSANYYEKETYNIREKYYVRLGEIIWVKEIITEVNGDNVINKPSSTKHYYICNNDAEKQTTNNIAMFGMLSETQLNELIPKSWYGENYQIDEKFLSAEEKQTFKGHDSTIWIKSFVKDEQGNSVFKYINIGSLNGMVPTFDLIVDAPSGVVPQQPYFDHTSNIAHYDLHMQPQWGFRVATWAINDMDLTVQENEYSDTQVEWTKTVKLPNNTTTTLYAQNYLLNDGDSPDWGAEPYSSLPGKIFFNHKAFDKQVTHDEISDHTVRLDDLSKHSKKIKNNRIVIAPTGKSGETYQGSAQIDTQELIIELPAIGNMMSDAWDIIHGSLRNDDKRQYLTDENGNQIKENGKPIRVDSLQGRLDSIAELKEGTIPFKQANSGELVGATLQGDDWIVLDLDKDENIIKCEHKFISTPNTDSTLNTNDEQYNTPGQIALYTPYVDGTGHIMGHDIKTVTLPYSYKKVKTENNADNVKNIVNAENSSAFVTESETLNYKGANTWVQIGQKEGTIEFGHKIVNESFGKPYSAIDITSLPAGAKSQILNFGDQAKILNVTTDNAGHITNIGIDTITLPKLNITSDINEIIRNQVVCDIQRTADGLIKSTIKPTDLVLIDYDNKSFNTDYAIISSDSIGAALTKLENRIDNLEMIHNKPGEGTLLENIDNLTSRLKELEASIATLSQPKDSTMQIVKSETEENNTEITEE